MRAIRLVKALKRFIKRLIRLTSPAVRPQILFDSFWGKQYSDNPRAISEMMHRMHPEYRIVWYLNSRANRALVPDYVKIISNRTGFYRQLFSSFCYVTNCEFWDFDKKLKKEKQLYVQTWHGDGRFKKILYEVQPGSWSVHKMCDSDVVDIALAGSDFAVKTYRSAFRYFGRVDNNGSPRDERMLGMTPEDKEKIRKALGVVGGAKVLLYAPTFRDNALTAQKSGIDIVRTKKAVEDKYGGKWVVLVRGHVGKRLVGIAEADDCIDVTDYPDATDILSVTDFLISDYSSIVFDFYLTGKPLALAVFDMADYEAHSRELKVSPAEAGFPFASNQKELEDLISGMDDATLREAYEKVSRYYGTTQTGEAARKICEAIDAHFKSSFGMHQAAAARNGM